MPKRKWFGRPPKAFQRLRHPDFMAGKLFDVWFMPCGRNRLREKVAVTTDPSSWEGSMAYEKLASLVKERFEDAPEKANRAKLVITDRPEQQVVFELRWQE